MSSNHAPRTVNYISSIQYRIYQLLYINFEKYLTCFLHFLCEAQRGRPAELSFSLLDCSIFLLCDLVRVLPDMLLVLHLTTLKNEACAVLLSLCIFIHRVMVSDLKTQ